jgi:iron complex transport system substrate-binding protein
VCSSDLPKRIAARPGWADVPAVRDGEMHEIKSAIILTPGVCAIREGLPLLGRIFAEWAGRGVGAVGGSPRR